MAIMEEISHGPENGVNLPAFFRYLFIMAHVVSSACTKCGACIPICPTGSIFESTKQVVIDADTCGDHGLCAEVCPVKAISPKTKSAPAPQEWEEDADH